MKGFRLTNLFSIYSVFVSVNCLYHISFWNSGILLNVLKTVCDLIFEMKSLVE